MHWFTKLWKQIVTWLRPNGEGRRHAKASTPWPTPTPRYAQAPPAPTPEIASPAKAPWGEPTLEEAEVIAGNRQQRRALERARRRRDKFVKPNLDHIEV